jgi:hypothetical protein
MKKQDLEKCKGQLSLFFHALYLWRQKMYKLSLSLAVLCAILCISCDDPVSSTPGSTTNGSTNNTVTSSATGAICIYNGKVYVLGAYATNGVGKPCYWENGKRIDIDIESAETAQIRAIAVIGGDIYLAGVVGDHSSSNVMETACYWKNGKRYDLFADNRDSRLVALAVNNNGVYAAGDFYDQNSGHKKGFYQRIDQPESPTVLSGQIYSIYDMIIDGGKFYIAGNYTDSGVIKPCYWINQALTQLNGSDCRADTIAVSGNHVYTAGRYSTSQKAFYWIDQVKQADFSENRVSVSDIIVLGGDVYSIGDYGSIPNQRACYWKNGIRTDLPHGGVAGLTIDTAVSNTDFYIAGFYADTNDNPTACYWKVVPGQSPVRYDLH